MSDENIFADFKSAAKFIDKISLNNDELVITYKNGKTEKHFFKDLKKVTIITTDEGPFEGPGAGADSVSDEGLYLIYLPTLKN